MVNYTYDDQESGINPRKLSNPNPNISRQYSSFKNNPRIARVSPAFGGKDRHSKVWTIKGLRDRRIRLSIPSAMQLYHLQEQLKLNQPSKVIDWLIEVTKDDIDKLPPLQMAVQDLNLFHVPPKFVHQDVNSTHVSFAPLFNYTPNYDHQRAKGKEAIVESKLNTYSYDDHDFQQSSNRSNLSRFDHQLDTCMPQFLSNFSGNGTSSSFPPYLIPNHFQFLSSNSDSPSPNYVLPNSHMPVPLNLIDNQEKVPFGLNLNDKVDHG